MPTSTVAACQEPRDSVDRLLDSWAAVRPDLDLSPVAVIARLARVRRIIDAELEATFAEYGLNGSDFEALVTLRRLDQAGAISQRQLMRELGLTSGTVSVRVDRLSDQGLVTRAPDPADRRNTLVRLTTAGRALFDRVTPAHVRTERRLLAALDAEQREQLVTLLRLLLVSFEGSVCGDNLPRLGMTLAPAHISIEMRRSVGLPEIVGLLVRAVQPASRADRAGIMTGDVLTAAAGRELRSITSLYAALRGRPHARTLAVTLVRGVDTSSEVTIDLRHLPADDLPQPGPAAAPEIATHAI